MVRGFAVGVLGTTYRGYDTVVVLRPLVSGTRAVEGKRDSRPRPESHPHLGLSQAGVKTSTGDHLESETTGGKKAKRNKGETERSPGALSFAASARRRRRFFYANAHTHTHRAVSRTTQGAKGEGGGGQFGEIDADGGGSILLVSRDRYRYATEIHREGRREERNSKKC